MSNQIKSKVTINDIASEMGIASSTVSRALKNSSSISNAVKEKVWETAKRLGYNHVIVISQPKTIAIVVPELHNFFYSEVLAAIHRRININTNPISIYCSYNSFETERSIIENLDPTQVCCLVISQSMDAESSRHLTKLENKGIPIIMFNRVDYDYDCPKFLIDNYMDSYVITKHLLSAGYTRIAFAAKHYNCPIYKERVQAYKDALERNDVEFNPDYLVYSELTSDDTQDIITHFLSMYDSPDAIILPNYLAALQATSIAKIRNVKVPEQLAIVSFDEEPYSKYSNPTISGIERPLTEMGNAIAIMAQKIIEKQVYNKQEIKIFASNLIIRGSSLNRTYPK